MSLMLSKLAQRAGARHTDEYVPTIIPIITGNEKDIMDVTPHTAATIVTESMATTVVSEVLIERVRH